MVRLGGRVFSEVHNEKIFNETAKVDKEDIRT